MTFLAAAEAVLKAADRPLTAREITELALKRHLLTTSGRTPQDTMKAELYTAARANPHGAIQRIYTPRPMRAARGSVRWIYVG